MGDLLPVCAIGCSAGGLTALRSLLSALPKPIGFACMVVQHLQRHRTAQLVEVLRAETGLEVFEASDQLELRPGGVYVVPASRNLSIDGNVLAMSPRAEGSSYGTVNDLFEAVAAARQADGAAVVLSGSGSDGAGAVEAVRAAGGLVLTQDDSAQFASMPQAAVETGAVDATMSPTKIAEAITDFFARGHRPSPASRHSALDHDELRLVDLLHSTQGHDFGAYQPNLLRRRTAEAMARLGIDELGAYVERIAVDATMQTELVEKLLVGTTSFFRDRSAFGLLEDELIPELITAAHESNRPLRAWIAGCSTGEEAYSLMMLVRDAMTTLGGPSVDVQVLASDVNAESLRHAERGEYGDDDVAAIDPERRARHFDRIPGGWRINRDLRSSVTFLQHNALTDPPLSSMDLVMCRNLLIYLGPSAQRTLTDNLAHAVRPERILMVGIDESVVATANAGFDSIDDACGALRRNRHHAARASKQFGVSMQPAMRQTDPAQVANRQMMAAYEALRDQDQRSIVVLDDQLNVVSISGDTMDWLRPGPGRASLKISSMVQDSRRKATALSSLRLLLAGADHVPPAPFGDAADLTPTQQLSATRITAAGEDLLMLTIDPLQTDAVVSHRSQPNPVEDNSPLAAELLRSQLAALAAEHDTSNAQLTSAIEELMASNDELFSTNQQLLSLNEELRAVNDERQRRLDEVLELTADMEQALDATEIGMLFLTPELEIRRFNRPITTLLGLDPSDGGRRLSDIASRFVDENLIAAISDVATTGEPRFVNATDRDDAEAELVIRIDRYGLPRGKWGLFIAVVDIAQLDLSRRVRMLMNLLEAAPLSFAIWDDTHHRVFATASTHLPAGSTSPWIAETLGAAAANEHDRILATGEPTADLRHDADGIPFITQKFRVDVAGSPHVGSAAMTAEQARGLAELRQSTSALVAMVDNPQVPVVGLTAIDLNKMPIPGYGATAPGASAENLVPEDGAGLFSAVDEVIETGEARQVRVRYQTPEGLEIHELHLLPAEEDDVAVIAFALDITDHVNEVAAAVRADANGSGSDGSAG